MPNKHSDPASAVVGDDHAMTVNEFCAAYHIGRSTWKRLRARGDHPALTWITERRYVIRPQHAREWLDARTLRPGVTKASIERFAQPRA
jgi:hypothetical protein